jgi:HSP20 family protein
MWWGANMITLVADPFNTLLDLQRALESRTASDWLSEHTTSATGPFPPINVFQQGDAILAIIELPGIDKNDLHVQAKENTIRISGRKVVAYPEASVHRRERVSGDFDRTLSIPVQLDPDGIQAEYRDGVLALSLPRAERDRPRTVQIT